MLHSQPVRPLCSRCNRLPARGNGRSVLGFQRWHRYCASCNKQVYGSKRLKDNKCELCKFVAVDSCQLDLITDGGVVKTICACCHRLKVKQQNEQRRRNRELTVDSTVDWSQIRL